MTARHQRAAARFGPRRRETAVRLALAVALAAASAVVGVLAAPAGADTDGPTVTKTVEATRTKLADGKVSDIEPSRKVSVSVSATKNLRDRQNVAVTWSGAHPSANTDYDPNSTYADYAEYPMVLLQCRGTDAAKTLSPTTCWQPWPTGRNQQNNAGGPGGAFPPWRMDRWAATADRQQFSRLPNPVPADKQRTCPGSSVAQHNLPYVGADGTVFDGTATDTRCGEAPPESASSSDSGSVSLLPDNVTFAETGTDGKGSALFNMRDAVTNASIGCSAKVACSLVAVPVMGTSCDEDASQLPLDQRPTGDDATAANDACEARGVAPTGVKVSGGGNGSRVSYAVTGRLWWSQSNWRNRVSFPLSFAPAANVCDLDGGAKPAPVYGSELLIQATTQWGAKLCAGDQAGFKHIQTSEPQARTLLQQKLINAAFGSDPPVTPFPTPTVQAPVAATGFAISFVIDGPDHEPVQKLKLTPRLLAKLLTQSYPVRRQWAKDYIYRETFTDPKTKKPVTRTSDPLKNNPLDLTYDPEFTALNPGVGHQANNQGTGALLALSSQSDVMFALTSYIDADPEARAWLDGQRDPWGMVVNPNYKGIALPVATLTQLDTWAPAPNPDPETQCDSINPQPPALGRIAAPLGRMADIAQSVQFAQPDEQGKCVAFQDAQTGVISGYRYARVDRQPPGFRFLIGVTSVADTYRYGLLPAQLQSHVSDSAPAKFSDADGRDFVAPTDAALRHAASHLKFDAASATWPIQYDALRADPDAYPGFQIVYADVLASGLSASDATTYARMLTYLAGPGQQPGSGVGQLPSGYLPLTGANGLGALAKYTAKAALLVAAQKGLSADQTPTGPGGTNGAADGSGGRTTTGGTTGDTGPAAPPGSGAPVGANAPPAVTATKPATSAGNQAAATSVGNTVADRSSLSQVLLIALIVALALGPVGVPVLLGTRRKGTAP